MADAQNVRKRLSELRKEIRRHNRKYYELDLPEISDYEYDRLMLELKSLEEQYPEFITPTSPTQTVGGKPDRRVGIEVPHDVPMLSLRDVFSTGDVEKFVDDIKKKFPDAEFLVEEKVDGLSAAMRYRNGKLELVLTRGDGAIGEDVTQNARSIQNLITDLDGAPSYLEIRGEVFITKQDFERLNVRQRSLGLKTFANPRNCAAGSLRHLSSTVAASRRLSFVVFDLMKADGDPHFECHSDFYRFLERNGVNVIHNYKLCVTVEEVLRAIEEIGLSRPELDYDIDGAVLKVNRFDMRSELGGTSKFPHWSIAYKFPPEVKRTVIREIELNVGRTGKITPVAIFDPITLAGTTVSRATLHNRDFIKALDIRIGSTVEVFKSGEIIPKIKAVVDNPEGSTPYEFTDKCPICRSMLDPDWCCVNPNCPAQLENHILNFVGKNAMDIDGLGSNAVHKLVELGMVKGINDIFTLDRAELIDKNIFGEKVTDKVLEAIERSKTSTPERLLTGLGIREVSLTTAQELIDQFGSLDNIINASLDELNRRLSRVSAPTVRVVAKNIRDFFDVEDNRARVADADPIKLLCEVPKVGEKTATELLSKIPELERIADAPIEVLNEWVSKARARESLVVARNVRVFFDLEDNRKLIDRLRSMGLNMGETSVESGLRGGVIVFTGTLTITRAEAANRATTAGFTVKNSITKGTDYLVVGDKPGSKLKKAEALGITILNEDQFNALVDPQT